MKNVDRDLDFVSLMKDFPEIEDQGYVYLRGDRNNDDFFYSIRATDVVVSDLIYNMSLQDRDFGAAVMLACYYFLEKNPELKEKYKKLLNTRDEEDKKEN